MSKYAITYIWSIDVNDERLADGTNTVIMTFPFEVLTEEQWRIMCVELQKGLLEWDKIKLITKGVITEDNVKTYVAINPTLIYRLRD